MQAGTNNKSKILLIYTGGTIGMIESKDSGSYIPFSVKSVLEYVPKLKSLKAEISVVSFEKPLDFESIFPVFTFTSKSNTWIKTISWI